MNIIKKIGRQALCVGFLAWNFLALAENQTPTVDTPIPAGKDVPFKIRIEQTEMMIPKGLHSYGFALHDGKWLLVSGRTNGMHYFENNDDNFPVRKQNRDAYVIDPIAGKVYVRALDSENSGLEEWQIDLLSTTSPQFIQIKDKLYLTGGYGVDSRTGNFDTKPFLTAIDVPGLMQWVIEPKCQPASCFIRHLYNETFRVTGGVMQQVDSDPILLIGGQNFDGFYFHGGVGDYTRQIIRFDIIDNGCCLAAKIYSPIPFQPDPNLRRRDLNVVPILSMKNGKLIKQIEILSGVFTETDGIWTVPVTINRNGSYFMPDPKDPHTFKQGMNNYACANFGIFSPKTNKMYTLLLGGISFGYFEDGTFETNSQFPFINQVTAVERDGSGQYTQYLLEGEYPKILSTGANPGNPLLFGAGAQFLSVREGDEFDSTVFNLDNLMCKKKPFLAGYIVGGIASTVPNTQTRTDSIASPYIFKVIIEPICQ